MKRLPTALVSRTMDTLRLVAIATVLLAISFGTARFFLGVHEFSSGAHYPAAQRTAAEHAFWLASPIPSRTSDDPLSASKKAMLATSEIQMICEPDDADELGTWVECNSHPELISADQVPAGKNIPIIGVQAAGKYYAFATEGMLAPADSIVSLQCQDLQLAVAYNSLRNKARAFAAPAIYPPHRFGVAGQTMDDDVMLVIDGKLYSHGGVQFPLAEVDCVQTNWEDWRAKHPTTAFCSGGMVLTTNG